MKEEVSDSASKYALEIQKVLDGYQQLQPRYELFSDYLKKLLDYVCRLRFETAIVQARAKNPASVVGKTVRGWSVGKYRRSIQDITDLCGARIIVQLLGEATELTAWLSQCFFVREYENMLERLRPEAFGYRGEHLLVTLDPRLLPKELVTQEVLSQMPDPTAPLPQPKGSAGIEDKVRELRSRLLLSHPQDIPILDGDMWRELSGLVAEIQVRTIAQHAYSEVGHSRIYKSSLILPSDHHRSMAKIAAMLEAVDEEMGGLVDRIEIIQKNARRFLDDKEAEQEIRRLRAILSVEFNASAARDLVSTQLAIGDHDGALQTIEECSGSWEKTLDELKVLRGLALISKHRETGDFLFLQEGREILLAFLEQGNRCVETATALAESWLIDGRIPDAMKAFALAYDIDPSYPPALAGYLRYHIVDDKGTRRVRMLKPSVEQAIARCQQQIAARANLPDALFLLAEFFFVLEGSQAARKAEAYRRRKMSPQERRKSEKEELRSTYEGLYATCRAITLTPRKNRARFVEFAERMHIIADAAGFDVPGAEWAKTLIQLALHVRGEKNVGLSGEVLPLDNGQVLIVAGACDMSDEVRNTSQRELMKAVADEFRGLILSGGTTAGIAGLVGELCKARNGDEKERVISTVGYLPQAYNTTQATQDERYTEPPRTTTGYSGFSALEPLQNWTDLLVESGVDPATVRLLGIGGGKIAAFEYHLAAALGAQTAIIRESGRAADRLLLEESEPGNENIRFLPADSETVRAFVGQVPEIQVIEKNRDRIAESISAAYDKFATELVSRELSEEAKTMFKRSNMDQAQHIAAKLDRIGLYVAPTADERDSIAIPEEAIRDLAKMEHGRWVVERTLGGWRLGSERNDKKKTRPQLIPWDELDETEKEKDIQTVRGIPEFLKACDLKIVKKT